MYEELTQGSIIADVRSLKYTNTRCKGVVISARCDFANRKIKYFHCLSAMSLKDWIYEVLYYNIVDELLKNTFNNVEMHAKQKELDIETLKEFGFEKTKEVVKNNYSKKELEKVMECINEWEQYSEALKSSDRKSKLDLLNGKKAIKILNDRMKNLYNGAYPKYCFIPEKAYASSETSIVGLVVDLQDIMQYDISLKENIEKDVFDFSIIKCEILKRGLNQNFFFDNDDDFIILEGLVKSPWIEYLLQLFANSFIRIGVDNASVKDIEKYCTTILKEKV